MANQTSIAGVGPTTTLPAIRKIRMASLKRALRKGFDDFRAKPSHVIFLCVIYPLVGLILSRVVLGYQATLPLLFPLVAGFALLGPLAALGLYELSRRRERGLECSWRDAFNVVRSTAIGAIGALSAVLLVLFFAWLRVALGIYQLTFGNVAPESLGAFVEQVFTTQQGWTLILAGCAAGFIFAVVALTISVVSFPLLLDRGGGAIGAVQTSIRAVLANPIPLAAWGLIVAVALVLGSLPFLAGLAIVLPILGHATWHLYRELVER